MYTLKLDASWRPIEVIDAYRAFNMTYSGRAKAVEVYDHGPTELFQFPSVIVLKSYISKRSFNLSCTRRNVIWRDKYTCQYCLKRFKFSQLTMDHVIPKSKGGKKIWTNITTSCLECNNKKGSQTPDECGMHPATKPVKPVVKLLDFHREIKNIPLQWEPFLN